MIVYKKKTNTLQGIIKYYYYTIIVELKFITVIIIKRIHSNSFPIK